MYQVVTNKKCNPFGGFTLSQLHAKTRVIQKPLLKHILKCFKHYRMTEFFKESYFCHFFILMVFARKYVLRLPEQKTWTKSKMIIDNFERARGDNVLSVSVKNIFQKEKLI